MAVASFLTHFLIFAGFLLLLLVTLSVPIIKSIYLAKVNVAIDSSLLRSGVHDAVRIGIWGYCVGGTTTTVIGISHTSGGQCSPKKLGYDLAIANTDIGRVATRALTAALVLHPIACGLAFIALLLSLFISFRRPTAGSRIASLLTLFVTVLSAIVATVVFVIDVVLVAEARHKSKQQLGNTLGVDWGNAVWMCLGAAVALWLATVGALFGIFACGHRRKGDYATARY